MVLWGPSAPVSQSPGVDWDYSVITGGLTVLLRFCVRAGDPDSGPQAGTRSTLPTEPSPQPQFLSMLMILLRHRSHEYALNVLLCWVLSYMVTFKTHFLTF